VAKTKWVLGTKSGEQTLVVSVKGTDASSRLVIVASASAAKSATSRTKESGTRRP
jgi:hypothetical protein